MWAPHTWANCAPAWLPKRLSTREPSAWVFCPSAASAAWSRSGERRRRARIMSATRTECCATRAWSRIPAPAPWSCPEPEDMFMPEPPDGEGPAAGEADDEEPADD